MVNELLISFNWADFAARILNKIELKDFITLITGAAIPLTILYINKSEDRKNAKTHYLDAALKNDRVVSIKLEDIKDRYQADRVTLCQFHNGGCFYPSGNSIMKFSMFYEIPGIGIERVQDKYQNVPVSLFQRILDEIFKTGYLVVPDHKKLQTELIAIRYMVEDTKLKSSYRFSIQTIDNKKIGILGIDYYKKKRVLKSDEILQLVKTAALLAGEINNKIVSSK